MKIVIEGWDPIDRQPVRGELTSVDRAQTQAADLVTVVLSAASASASASASEIGDAAAAAGGPTAPPLRVTIKQNPTLLQRTKPGEVRVGAAVWDSGYILSALMEREAELGKLRLRGARVAELGAGCALAGLVAARMGASVVLTDKADVLVHARGNAAKNRLLWTAGGPPPPPPLAAAAARTPAGGDGGGSGGSGTQAQGRRGQQQQQEQQQPPGSASVMPLDWSAPDAMAQAAAVLEAMGGPADLVIASDSIYPDPTGCATNAKGFVEACAALCGPETRVLVTYEWRLPEVREALLGAARARFSDVRVLAAEELPEGWRTQHVEAFEMRL